MEGISFTQVVRPFKELSSLFTCLQIVRHKYFKEKDNIDEVLNVVQTLVDSEISMVDLKNIINQFPTFSEFYGMDAVINYEYNLELMHKLSAELNQFSIILTPKVLYCVCCVQGKQVPLKSGKLLYAKLPLLYTLNKIGKFKVTTLRFIRYSRNKFTLLLKKFIIINTVNF